MKNQFLIINDNDVLFDILHEMSDNLNYSIFRFLKKEFTEIKTLKNSNYLILTKKKISNIRNQVIIDKYPINIFKLFERLNM